jgi:hypothetical protein
VVRLLGMKIPYLPLAGGPRVLTGSWIAQGNDALRHALRGEGSKEVGGVQQESQAQRDRVCDDGSDVS